MPEKFAGMRSRVGAYLERERTSATIRQQALPDLQGEDSILARTAHGRSPFSRGEELERGDCRFELDESAGFGSAAVAVEWAARFQEVKPRPPGKAEVCAKQGKEKIMKRR